MCVLLAALGFIVAVVAVIGYRDIKATARRAGLQAAQQAIESKLQEYPDAARIHSTYQAMNRYIEDMMRREAVLSQIRAASSDIAEPSKEQANHPAPAKRPRRYPKRAE